MAFIYFINTQDPAKKRLRKDLKNIIKEGSIVKHLYNDYRELFLPETQFINLNFEEIELNFLNLNQCYFGKCHTFFLEQYKDNLIIADRNTKIRSIKFDDLLNRRLNFENFNTNLDIDYILDIKIHNNNGNMIDNNSNDRDTNNNKCARDININKNNKHIRNPINRNNNDDKLCAIITTRPATPILVVILFEKHCEPYTKTNNT